MSRSTTCFEGCLPRSGEADSAVPVFLDPAVAGPALRQLARGGSAVESLSGRELDVLEQLARGGTKGRAARL